MCIEKENKAAQSNNQIYVFVYKLGSALEKKVRRCELNFTLAVMNVCQRACYPSIQRKRKYMSSEKSNIWDLVGKLLFL